MTLYPSSPSEAAPAPPASPVPTTRIVYLRRFAGFTSFISKRRRSHLRSIGPGGTRASSAPSRGRTAVSVLMSDTLRHLTRPPSTARGIETLPTTTTTATTTASPR